MKPIIPKKLRTQPPIVKFTKTEQIANLRRLIRTHKARGKLGSDAVLSLRNRLKLLMQK